MTYPKRYDLILGSVTQIVAANSVDGIFTSAAVLCYAPDANVQFYQDCTVDQIDPQAWKLKRRVLFVNLTVDNRHLEITVALLSRITEAGHQILGVCGDGSAYGGHLEKAFGKVGLDFSGLAMMPIAGVNLWGRSSLDRFLCLAEEAADKSVSMVVYSQHVRELLRGDSPRENRSNARTTFNKTQHEIVEAAVKVPVAHDNRHVHLARWLAQDKDEPDSTIREWGYVYPAVIAAHEEIVTERLDLGDGLVRVSALGRLIDMTTLIPTLCDLGVKIVIIEGEFFASEVGEKIRQIAFATLDERISQAFKVEDYEFQRSDFGWTVYVALADEPMVINTLRRCLLKS